MLTKTMVMNLQATNSVMTFMPGRKVPSNIYALVSPSVERKSYLALLFTISATHGLEI